jgi:hypothetical protein
MPKRSMSVTVVLSEEQLSEFLTFERNVSQFGMLISFRFRRRQLRD